MNTFFVLICFLAFYTASRIVIVKEDELLAEFTHLCEFIKFRPPGMYFKFSRFTWTKIKLGETGEVLNEELIRIEKRAVPYQVDERISPGERVRFVRFGEKKVAVSRSVEGE